MEGTETIGVRVNVPKLVETASENINEYETPKITFIFVSIDPLSKR
jgi:hypothetical protein